MSYIEGTRFNKRMQNTPEGILAMRENNLPFGELAAKFNGHAESVLENKLLVGSIMPHLEKITSMNAENAESICTTIARQNPKAFPDTLEDVRQRAAYVFVVAHEMKQGKTH
ncbi:hypothetical protein HZC00_00120 [Candidatus Kaiserbacteria bacterium]|nr:hypothetical protein [Candidatus Kaiserbacteria bacterium]